jgi:hypothetical protein
VTSLIEAAAVDALVARREAVERDYRKPWAGIVAERVTAVGVSTDKQWLALRREDGAVALCYTDADCCSSSWIEHVNGEELFPATVLSVEGTDVSRDDEHPEHDCLQVYETVFVTDRGRFTVEYRNASNGYYGGSLGLVGLIPAEKVGSP